MHERKLCSRHCQSQNKVRLLRARRHDEGSGMVFGKCSAQCDGILNAVLIASDVSSWPSQMMTDSDLAIARFFYQGQRKFCFC